MKIGILSRNPKLYSTSRLVEAARERGGAATARSAAAHAPAQ